MSILNRTSGHVARDCLVGVAGLIFCAAQSYADSQGKPDPIVMATESIGLLEQAKSISAEIHIAEEAVLSSGLKVKMLREGSLTLQRSEESPGFVFSRRGSLVDQKMAFDGRHLYMLGQRSQAMVSVPAEGNLDEIMDFMVESGAYLPGRDLLYSDAAEVLLEDVRQSAYGGLMPVNGASCHYLSFRGPDVDWHLWVNAETSLPCRYMITSKFMTAAPEFEMVFMNWQLDQPVDRSLFTLVAPTSYTQASEFTELQPKY